MYLSGTFFMKNHKKKGKSFEDVRLFSKKVRHSFIRIKNKFKPNFNTQENESLQNKKGMDKEKIHINSFIRSKNFDVKRNTDMLLDINCKERKKIDAKKICILINFSYSNTLDIFSYSDNFMNKKKEKKFTLIHKILHSINMFVRDFPTLLKQKYFFKSTEELASCLKQVFFPLPDLFLPDMNKTKQQKKTNSNYSSSFKKCMDNNTHKQQKHITYTHFNVLPPSLKNESISEKYEKVIKLSSYNIRNVEWNRRKVATDYVCPEENFADHGTKKNNSSTTNQMNVIVKNSSSSISKINTIHSSKDYMMKKIDDNISKENNSYWIYYNNTVYDIRRNQYDSLHEPNDYVGYTLKKLIDYGIGKQNDDIQGRIIKELNERNAKHVIWTNNPKELFEERTKDITFNDSQEGNNIFIKRNSDITHECPTNFYKFEECEEINFNCIRRKNGHPINENYQILNGENFVSHKKEKKYIFIDKSSNSLANITHDNECIFQERHHFDTDHNSVNVAYEQKLWKYFTPTFQNKQKWKQNTELKTADVSSKWKWYFQTNSPQLNVQDIFLSHLSFLYNLYNHLIFIYKCIYENEDSYLHFCNNLKFYQFIKKIKSLKKKIKKNDSSEKRSNKTIMEKEDEEKEEEEKEEKEKEEKEKEKEKEEEEGEEEEKEDKKELLEETNKHMEESTFKKIPNFLEFKDFQLLKAFFFVLQNNSNKFISKNVEHFNFPIVFIFCADSKNFNYCHFDIIKIAKNNNIIYMLYKRGNEGLFLSGLKPFIWIHKILLDLTESLFLSSFINSKVISTTTKKKKNK